MEGSFRHGWTRGLSGIRPWACSFLIWLRFLLCWLYSQEAFLHVTPPRSSRPTPPTAVQREFIIHTVPAGLPHALPVSPGHRLSPGAGGWGRRSALSGLRGGGLGWPPQWEGQEVLPTDREPDAGRRDTQGSCHQGQQCPFFSGFTGLFHEWEGGLPGAVILRAQRGSCSIRTRRPCLCSGPSLAPLTCTRKQEWGGKASVLHDGFRPHPHPDPVANLVILLGGSVLPPFHNERRR